LSTAVASTLLRSSVAAIFAGGAAFALEMVGAGIAGPGAGGRSWRCVFGCELQHGFRSSSLIRGGRFDAWPGDARIYFVDKARRPMGFRIRTHYQPSFRFRARHFCCCLVLGADVACRMRWAQSREIGFAGLVGRGCVLRGRGTKSATVNAAMQIRRKLGTIPPLLPGSLCCAAQADDAKSRQINPATCIGHSRDDGMVAQLRIFLSKRGQKSALR
jgi:hypothetical protein